MWFLFWFWFWLIIAWFTSTRGIVMTSWQNGDNLNEDNLKNEDDLKVGDNLQNEAELRSPQCLWLFVVVVVKTKSRVPCWSMIWSEDMAQDQIHQCNLPCICIYLFISTPHPISPPINFTFQLKLTENTQKSAISSSYYFTGGRCLGWSHLLLLLFFCHFIPFLYLFVWLVSMRSSI